MRTRQYAIILAALTFLAVLNGDNLGGRPDDSKSGPLATTRASRLGPEVYVPYADLAAVVDPAAKAVLMDRAEFEKLLAAARIATTQAGGEPPPAAQAAQVTKASYIADVVGDKVMLAGVLDIQSNSDRPVAMAPAVRADRADRLDPGRPAGPAGRGPRRPVWVLVVGPGKGVAASTSLTVAADDRR